MDAHFIRAFSFIKKMKTVPVHVSLLFTLCLNAQTEKIEMKTSLGSIVVELYSDKAPITCENFLRYVKNEQFVGAHFYRTVRPDNQPNNDVKIEVIQGGLGFRKDRPYPPIRHETTEETGLTHVDGTFSMARSKPGTASSEFFICIGDQPELDFGGARNPDGKGFAAFGRVTDGMDIVREIQNLAADGQRLVESVHILTIKILK